MKSVIPDLVSERSERRVSGIHASDSKPPETMPNEARHPRLVRRARTCHSILSGAVRNIFLVCPRLRNLAHTWPIALAGTWLRTGHQGERR